MLSADEAAVRQLDRSGDLVAQIEDKTVLRRVCYRLQLNDAQMTAPGLAENLGVAVRDAVRALNILVNAGYVDRDMEQGPRPLYRWNSGKKIGPAMLDELDLAFAADAAAGAAPLLQKAPEVAAPDQLKVAADAAIARATATANLPKTAEPTMAEKILAVFKPGEKITPDEVVMRLHEKHGPGVNRGTVHTTISNLRNQRRLCRPAQGWYALPGYKEPVKLPAPAVRAWSVHEPLPPDAYKTPGENPQHREDFNALLNKAVPPATKTVADDSCDVIALPDEVLRQLSPDFLRAGIKRLESFLPEPKAPKPERIADFMMPPEAAGAVRAAQALGYTVRIELDGSGCLCAWASKP